MKRTTQQDLPRATVKKSIQLVLKKRMREGLSILSCACALFLLLALLTHFHRDDLGRSHHIFNLGGHIGASLSRVLLYSFGHVAYLFPCVLFYAGWSGFKNESRERNPRLSGLKILGFIFIICSASGLLMFHGAKTCASGTFQNLSRRVEVDTRSVYENLQRETSQILKSEKPVLQFAWQSMYPSPGIVGAVTALMLERLFGFAGSVLLLFAVLFTGITLTTGLSWITVIDKTGQAALAVLNAIQRALHFLVHSIRVSRAQQKAKLKTPPPTLELDNSPKKAKSGEAKDHSDVAHSNSEEDMPVPKSIPKEPKEFQHRQETPVTITKAAQPVQVLPKTLTDDSLPPLELLDLPEQQQVGKGYTHEELENLSREVELRLMDFGVEVKVVAVHPGPVVTRFEMQLAAGIKVNRITTLAKDLARSLAVISVRVVEIIPGKSVVGLELPNKHREIVRLSEVLASSQYGQARSPLSLALGKDIAGHPVIVDLAKMPHLLVAGTTGAGKSVGLNAMLLSILYKSTPDKVRLVMIDPKMLELSIYEGIPHLLAPVVTDMKEAANALRWCVAEMERRYKLMAALGVRNLAGYNQKIQDAERNNQPIKDPLAQPSSGEPAENLTTLPYIVVLVDEFADMMMVVGKKTEELIARIAQKARAAGIHLILATQRPSVDVITGLIKANIPTRIAFQVSSKIDSRTILDQQGAEQLLGYGDMLYLAPGTGIPIRVHGAFVADHEVHAVVNELKRHAVPDYVMDITGSNPEFNESTADIFGDSVEQNAELDVLYDQAVQIVIKSRRASISHVQRRLKIGYNRAARLMEEMEKAGLVSAMESNGNREILVPVDES